MDRVQVLEFVNVLDRGGTESFIFNNLDVMDREGLAFDFLLTRDQVEPLEDRLRALHCRKCVILPQGRTRFAQFLSIYLQMRVFLRNSCYQVIHFHSNPPGIRAVAPILAARRAKVPVRILHSHSSGGERVSFKVIRPALTFVCRWINTHACNRYVAPSVEAAKYGFGNKITQTNCTYIRNAVHVTLFRYSVEKRAQYRRAMRCEDRVVIGTVGRFSDVKNMPFLVQVFAALSTTQTNAVLLLVGGDVQEEPGVRERLQAQVSAAGLGDRVIFWGETEDVQGMLSAMDVFIFPSRSEALGIAAIEAQINGLPVVAASNGIPKEVDISGNVEWRDLQDPVTDWMQSIVRALDSGRKVIDLTTERIQSYDAEYTSKQLRVLYLEGAVCKQGAQIDT